LARIRAHVRDMAHEAFRYLQTHSALETVVQAVRWLEDDPLFNAGTGSSLQEDGCCRMSASVMDGASLRFAAVLNIERVRNPVLVAHASLTERDRVLAGKGAIRFARSRGLGSWDPVTPQRRRQWQRWRGDRDGCGDINWRQGL
jgi:L-asparaginase